MRFKVAFVVLPLALVLAGCGSAVGGATNSPSSSSLKPSSTSTTPTTAEALSGKATCDRLVGNGDDALGLRVADYTVEIMNANTIDDSAYRSAKELAHELDELDEAADPTYSDAIGDLQAGPQSVVDAVENSESDFDIPAQEMMQAGLDAGEECLSGPALDAYAGALSDRINQLPPEHGGKGLAQARSQCFETMYVGILNEGWSVVVPSIGAADHRERVESFRDTVSDLSDDSEPGCAGDVELAFLAFESSVLQASVVISGEADAAQYDAVREGIEAWLEAIDRTDVVVATP